MSRVYLEQRDAFHVPGARSPEEVEAALAQGAQALIDCDAWMITAGAGMGVDSGLPDFRGTTGLWKDRDVAMSYEDMSDDKWFVEDPLFAWGVNYTQMEMYRKTQPHSGFAAVLRWASVLNKPYFVFTSNIDGQFEKAGFPPDRVVTCHGDMHHLQCTSRKCKGLEPDRSDEAWISECIPSGLESLIDAGTLRFQDTAALEAPGFRCPRCGALARPNLWFCHDGNFVPRKSLCETRAVYNEWLTGLQKAGRRIAVVECGGGLAIPSVRVEGEDAVESAGAGSCLIRLNPADCKVPAEQAVGIPLGAREGLTRLEAALKRLLNPARAGAGLPGGGSRAAAGRSNASSVPKRRSVAGAGAKAGGGLGAASLGARGRSSSRPVRAS